MAFEHWNRFLQDYLKQREDKQPPPQKMAAVRKRNSKSDAKHLLNTEERYND